MIPIDTSFDFSTDAHGGDPDSKSPTLKRYHTLLWSKELPNGDNFNLQADVEGSYLHFKSASYEVSLSSDSIANSYRDVKRMKQIIEKIPPDDVESFWRLNCTIGAFIIFPAKKVDGNMTINQMRGVSPQIADRFDLTLECIRRFYDGGVSPLEETLNRYEEFFKLFQSFQGYVDFFLLNDLVNAQNQKIHFFTEIDESFHSSAFPGSVEEYLKYREKSMDFITQRNARIADWTATQNRLS
jgi:hypothetical protein